MRGENRVMMFGVPQIWREPTDHLEDCFFCMGDASSLKTYGRKLNTHYPDIPSSIAPVPHSDPVLYRNTVIKHAPVPPVPVVM